MKSRNRLMLWPACVAASFALVGTVAQAHSPVFNCSKAAQGAITCTGGFSDGSSAAGAAVRIVDMQDKVLVNAKLDAQGRYTFKPPAQAYHVVFDGGKNHQVSVYGGDIE
ncbi:MAG: hypothetical protein QM696_14335 [Steroidobacteraceae bacterium]